MKWLIVVLACVVLVIVFIAIVGSMLPKNHIASRQEHYRSSTEAVFRMISDFQATPTWRTDVKKVEMLPTREGKTTFREFGRSGPLTIVVEEMAPPNHLVSRIVDNPSFGGTWTYELIAEPGGCALKIIERGEVYNPIFRFSRFIFSHTATMDAYLTALGKKLP